MPFMGILEKKKLSRDGNLGQAALPLGPQCPSPGLISVYCSAKQHWQESTTCQLYKCSECWQPLPSVPTASHCQHLRRSAQGGWLGSGGVTIRSSPRPAADESEGTKPSSLRLWEGHPWSGPTPPPRCPVRSSPGACRAKGNLFIKVLCLPPTLPSVTSSHPMGAAKQTT